MYWNCTQKNADLYQHLAVRLYKLKDLNPKSRPRSASSRRTSYPRQRLPAWVDEFHHAVSEARHHHQRGRFEGCIKIYREDKPAIVELWADVEASSIKTVETGATRRPRWCFGTYPLCGKASSFRLSMSGRLLPLPLPGDYGT